MIRKVRLTHENEEGVVIKPSVFLKQDFIGVWDDVFPDNFCEFIKNYVDTSSYLAGRDTPYVQDKQICISAFSPAEADYCMEGVNHCLKQYINWYPYLKNFSYHSSLCLLQKTEPLQGYHPFHCEDTTWDAVQRTLAWMVYFNDVDEGGETEWLYQQLKIQPKVGRVVIWPGAFTHLHRGNPPMSDKYIATGWYVSSQGMYEHEVSSQDPPS